MKMKTIKKYFVLSQVYVLICIVGVPFTVARLSASGASLPQIIHEKKNGDTEEYVPAVSYTVGGEDMEEYLKGVVAAEMPVSFPLDALKAQAVASRTYAVRAVENAEFELAPADIGQAYITKEKMKENWGENFETYYAKICEAVDTTAGEIMEYDGEPILAVFHSTSAGETETAGNIWNYDLPYLESTDSQGDTFAPNYEVTKTISEDEIIASIKEKHPDFQAEAGTLFDTIKINERSQAGYITDISIAGMTFTGKEVREALGLRSSNFTVAKAEDGISFTTKGFGHGAGMSQYGAKYMAEKGSDYKDILDHYYKNVTIAKL